jgi:hypothetical protein
MSFELIQNFKVSHFTMAKVIKVNITVTYQAEPILRTIAFFAETIF